jgi:hypothetical protein
MDTHRMGHAQGRFDAALDRAAGSVDQGFTPSRKARQEKPLFIWPLVMPLACPKDRFKKMIGRYGLPAFMPDLIRHPKRESALACYSPKPP